MKLNEMNKDLEWARSVRRKYANWEFINKQPPRIKAALIYLVETGDLYVASRIANLTVEEMDELRMKANIPIVIP